MGDLSTTDEHAQQMPTPNGHPSIQSLVHADLTAREQVGVQRYGTSLQPHNGRDMLRDAYEEAMDLTVYLRGVMEERDNPAPVADSDLRDRFASVLGQDVTEFMHPDEFGGYDIDYGRLAEIAHEWYGAELADAAEARDFLRAERDGARRLLRERNKAYGRASATIGVLRGALARDKEVFRRANEEMDKLRAERDKTHYHCVKCKARTGIVGHPNGCPEQPVAPATPTEQRVWRKGDPEPPENIQVLVDCKDDHLPYLCRIPGSPQWWQWFERPADRRRAPGGVPWDEATAVMGSGPKDYVVALPEVVEDGAAEDTPAGIELDPHTWTPRKDT